MDEVQKPSNPGRFILPTSLQGYFMCAVHNFKSHIKELVSNM
jgi:hypothetical protein